MKKLPELLKLCLVLSLFYVTLGDLLLPYPYSQMSTQIKLNINEFLVGLFPEGNLNKLKRTQTTLDQL